jgi:hypothetical protein
MDTIATYMTLIAGEAAALPRFMAWSALVGAFVIWFSRWRGGVAACVSLALVGAALAIAGLPARAHDPILWGTLAGGVFLGVGMNWSRTLVWHWVWALAVCVLGAVLSLYILTLPAQDAEALVIIDFAGASVGDWLPRLIQREARSA